MVDAIDSKSILGCQGAGSSPVVGKLVLLDFDGLLVDTERLHHLAYEKALLKWKSPLEVDFFTYISLAHASSGTALKEYVYKLYPEHTGKWEEIRKDKLLIYSDLVSTQITLMPFVEQFLTCLEKKKIPTAVVTNSLKRDIETAKSKLPLLNKIPHWITRENYTTPKPHPDGYLTALKLYPHINPHEATGFEDTLKGIEALKGAHVKPFLICHPSHPQLKNARNVAHFPSLEAFCIK